MLMEARIIWVPENQNVIVNSSDFYIMSKQTTWVTGHHAVNAVLEYSPQRSIALWVVLNPNNSVLNELIGRAKSLGIVVHSLDKKQLAKRTGTEQHQSIALEVTPKQDGSERDLASFVDNFPCHNELLFLVLDQVQDPHNFGACLRTADAAGAHGVIVAKDNASPMTPVVQKVASGAAETMPIFRVTNLSRSLDSLRQQGVWVIGTSDKATNSIFAANLSGPMALVMGAEGKGMRRLTEKKCDTLVSLPMAGSIVSSLNVSVATGVCLYEIVRQRSVGLT